MGGVTYAGLGLSFLAMVGVMFATISKEWKRNSPESSQANFNQVYNSEGLWVRCNSPLPGQYSCDRYDVPLFGVESYLQAQRAMMILACIFIVSSVITSTVSLPCTSALNEKAKRYAAMTAGVLAILAGILTLAAVSWYAAGVVMEFNQQQLVNATFVYEFGTALYIGWISSILAIIAGILLLCCNCGATDEADDYPYNYGPAKPVSANRPNTEYV